MEGTEIFMDSHTTTTTTGAAAVIGGWLALGENTSYEFTLIALFQCARSPSPLLLPSRESTLALEREQQQQQQARKASF